MLYRELSGHYLFYPLFYLSVSIYFNKGRILAGCYWFCILIWVSTYTANLAAFLTVKNAESPINSLEDLAKSNYELGVIPSTTEYEYFKESQDPTLQKIWRRMEAGNSFPKNGTEGVQWVRERENFVFITDGPFLRHMAKQPPCDLTTGIFFTPLVNKYVVKSS